MKKLVKCKRNDCQNRVLDIPEARCAYLCATHYSTRLRNQQNRLLKATQNCARQGCDKTLLGTHNQKFCSNECRHLASRLINDEVIFRIINHSYWRNVERFIKRNPKGLASINHLNDIADMVLLYVRKAEYQKSYVHYDENEKGHVLTPFMDLAVCHRYPNSEGGMNTLANTLVGPGKVNRLRSNHLPKKSHIEPLNGVKSMQSTIKLETTLFHGLTEMFSESEMTTLFHRIGRLSEFHFYKEKKNNLPTTLSRLLLEMPFTKLLRDECHRIGLPHVANKMHLIQKIFVFDYDFIEISSICLFYSLLSGDEGDLLKALLVLSDYQIVNTLDRTTFQQVSLSRIKDDWIQRILSYVSIYFDTEITTETQRLAFYASFFSFPKRQ
ncbi:hypothetical protein AAHD08_000487 [Providencia rettgeri]